MNAIAVTEATSRSQAPRWRQAEAVPTDKLRPDPANPRRISEDELDALERSVRQFGFVQPVLARREDRVVIGGHQRLVAARRLGLTAVPVICFDGSVEQARLLGLALNRIAGTWDEPLLGRLLAELSQTPDLDVSLSGFGEDEIAKLLAGLETREKRDRPESFDLDVSLSGFGEDEIAKLLAGLETREKRDRPESFDLDLALEEAAREPRTQPGDLWRLGSHRLLCGNATEPADLERVLGAQQAAMAFVDPPYNVDLGHYGGVQRDARRRKPIANDALDPVAWEAFVRGWARPLLHAIDGALYVCMSSKELPLVSRVLADEGGHWSDTLIWAKDRFVLGRADYQRSYEPIWYGWREGAGHHWCGDRDQGDVWQIARPSASPLHPVQKPLALVERALANSSNPGDVVLDGFLGSGTSLIAAERTGRRCAGVELDPLYVDVAVRRWEHWSGDRAAKADG